MSYRAQVAQAGPVRTDSPEQAAAAAMQDLITEAAIRARAAMVAMVAMAAMAAEAKMVLMASLRLS
jgi:hypothetical protein